MNLEPVSRFRKRCRRRPLRLKSVQAFNSYELTGCNERAPGQGLEEMVLEHLTVQRELAKLNAHEEVVLRMLAEGYGNAEIAAEMGVTTKTVLRLRAGLRASLERPALVH